MKIQINDYNFIDSKTEQTGFIVQQLFKVFPEAGMVGTGDPKKRPWMVDHGRVKPLLVKGIQELSKLNDELTTTVSNQPLATCNNKLII